MIVRMEVFRKKLASMAKKLWGNQNGLFRLIMNVKDMHPFQELMSSDMQHKCATQGTMIRAMQLVTPF